MEFSNERPIYLQIMDLIIQQILSKQLLPGEKVPAVRSLALSLETNPNTVQRALQELERETILYTQRGKGRFVTEDQTLLSRLAAKQRQEIIEDYLKKMTEIGIEPSEALLQLQAYLKEGQL
ncbi:GntR family transcriptional regulator [Enterococcus asini]|uniref:GntR family transcriptional regulator n=1 Tax=Enterococcus TaxID=1350 RepID=UPI002891EB25|nr:GntR family transcriptional regulator [Enterococcus asini]MDT2756501.1 GntR family transcriptional regulator [Enterococcus asini]